MTLELKENLIKELAIYVQKNQEKLYRLTYSYCQNQETAMDILQESITKAISKISNLKEPKYLTTWFYRILINTSIDHAKKLKMHSEFCIDDYNLENIKTKENNLADTISLYQQIDKLDVKLKTVIVLRFFENMKIEEIATIINSNTNTVKSRLYKALKMLKINMEEM